MPVIAEQSRAYQLGSFPLKSALSAPVVRLGAAGFVATSYLAKKETPAVLRFSVALHRAHLSTSSMDGRSTADENLKAQNYFKMPQKDRTGMEGSFVGRKSLRESERFARPSARRTPMLPPQLDASIHACVVSKLQSHL